MGSEDWSQCEKLNDKAADQNSERFKKMPSEVREEHTSLGSHSTQIPLLTGVSGNPDALIAVVDRTTLCNKLNARAKKIKEEEDDPEESDQIKKIAV